MSVTFKVTSAIESSNARDPGSLRPRSTASGWSQIERAVLLLGVYQPRVPAGWAKRQPKGVLDPKRYIWTLNGIEEAVAEDCKDSGFVSEPSSPLMC